MIYADCPVSCISIFSERRSKGRSPAFRACRFIRSPIPLWKGKPSTVNPLQPPPFAASSVFLTLRGEGQEWFAHRPTPVWNVVTNKMNTPPSLIWIIL